MCAGLSEADIAAPVVPPGLRISCFALLRSATLHALRNPASKRYVGRHWTSWGRQIESGASKCTAVSRLLRRRPRPHIVPRAAGTVRQSTFNAIELRAIIVLRRASGAEVVLNPSTQQVQCKLW